jgi:hypothetical protein
MSELLPTFMQLGFLDEDCLKGAAAWPRSELLYVLEKWKRSGLINDLQAETLRMAFERLKVEALL